MLDFDNNRDPVVPRDAATVMVVRPAEAGAGLQVFCVQRHVRSGFMGGAVVFPGGKVDASDHAPGWAERATPLGPRARSLAELESEARAFAIAALRELLEEAAMLPVVGGQLDSAAALALRSTLAERVGAGEPAGLALLELLASHDLSLDTAGLEAFARWITPAAETRRFDTRFYLLAAPAGQTGHHDEHETTTSFWRTPREVLELWSQGKIFLAPPTARTLELIVPAESIDQALAIARTQSLDPICPFFAQEGERVLLALPGDPLYPERRDPPSDPSAPTRFVLEDGRFVPRRAV